MVKPDPFKGFQISLEIICQAVMLYIRDLGQCDGLSNEQLKHLAITASSVFGSLDVALFCLDRLVERHAISFDIPKAFVDAMPKETHRYS